MKKNKFHVQNYELQELNEKECLSINGGSVTPNTINGKSIAYWVGYYVIHGLTHLVNWEYVTD